MKIGQGVKPGIGDYLPGGKSCRGHLEDEDDSQGHRRPLPCPLIYNKIILLEISQETWYHHKKIGRWKTWQ